MSRKSIGLGQGWVVPRIQAADADDPVPAADIADIIGDTPQVIRQ